LDAVDKRLHGTVEAGERFGGVLSRFLTQLLQIACGRARAVRGRLLRLGVALPELILDGVGGVLHLALELLRRLLGVLQTVLKLAWTLVLGKVVERIDSVLERVDQASLDTLLERLRFGGD